MSKVSQHPCGHNVYESAHLALSRACVVCLEKKVSDLREALEKCRDLAGYLFDRTDESVVEGVCAEITKAAKAALRKARGKVPR